MSSTNDTQANNTHAKGNTMRAVVWEGKPFEIAVRDVPRPKIELPEDAIVRITTAALCGSDLHTYHGVLGSPTPPWIMGHEGIGVVVEVGQATEHFKVGDRVLIPGVADPGFFSIDKTAGDQGLLYGMGPAFGGVEGGSQAEYLRVPFADDSLVAIPDDFSSDLDWLFLSDIFVTGWVGLDFAGFKTGDSVAIFGAGPVGLMCAYAALFRGASKVYVIDHIRDRLDKAASIGAIPVNFTSEAGTASEQILQREPNGVDRSVDCIGQACLNHRLKPQQNYVIQEAVRVTKFLGGIGLVGVYAALGKSAGTPLGDTMDKDLSVSIPDLWRKTLSIRGGSVGPYYYDILPKAFELVRSGRVRLDWVTTSRVGIEDAPKAYERFNNKLEIKVVIRFPWVRDQVLASSTEVGDQEATREVRDQSGERRPLRLPGQRKNRERFMF